MSQFDRTLIDLMESTARNFKALPLNLGAFAGSGGGSGAPPGGYIGWLPQTRVAYDTTEPAYQGIISAPSGTLYDNLAHIRYRLNILESGGSIIVTDDNNSLSYLDVTEVHFSGAGVIVTDLGGGEVRATISATGSGGGGDSTYLRLDTTNDPLTAQLNIIPTSNGDGGLYIETTGNAYSLDVEQYTVNNNVSVPAAFIYRKSSGTGNLSSDMMILRQEATGAGTLTGDFISCRQVTTEKFRVDKDGNAYTGTSLLVTDAASDSVVYGRQNAGWVAMSGIASDVGRLYYFTNNTQGILEDSAYMYSMETTSPKSTSTGTQNSIGNAEYKAAVFATDIANTGFANISKGTFRFYMTMKRNSGTRDVTAHMKLYKQDQAGTQTLLITSSSTSALTGSYVMYEMTAVGGPFTFNVSDRLVAKLYLTGGASGTDASVSHQRGNTDGERIEIPATSAIELTALETGWVPVSNVWTRTGNHTFTVVGDFTSKFIKGAKVRYKDGGTFEYGVIGSSTYSFPDTTVNLIPNDDYAMAAATITDTYLSYVDTPQGFPDWFTYTPTYSASGSMTYTSVSTNIAKWKASGRMMIVMVAASGTTGGTASNSLRATAPISETDAAMTNPASYADGGASSLGFSFISSGALNVRKADSSNYGLGASRTMNCSVIYQMA